LIVYLPLISQLALCVCFERTNLFNVAIEGASKFVIERTGNVGIGTTDPKATLDINGFMKLAKQSSVPETCAADYDGAIALTSTYRACVCNGTSWVFISDGSTACVWQ